MKQYINSNQLKELTPDQFRKLCKLIGDKYYYNETDENILKNFQKEHLTMYISILEKTNIGNMIAILCDSEFCFPSIGLTESSKRNEWIVVGITCLSGSKKYLHKTIEGDELCDALWNTIKLLLQDVDIEDKDLMDDL